MPGAEDRLTCGTIVKKDTGIYGHRLDFPMATFGAGQNRFVYLRLHSFLQDEMIARNRTDNPSN